MDADITQRVASGLRDPGPRAGFRLVPPPRAVDAGLHGWVDAAVRQHARLDTIMHAER